MKPKEIYLATTLAIAIIVFTSWFYLQKKIRPANSADNQRLYQPKPTYQVEERVVLIPKTKDLGTVIYGEVAETTFTLSNLTSKPLKIARVSTSCGCTKATVKKEVIDPFKETVVFVSFDPAVHKDETDLGEVTRTIFIETDNDNFALLESNIIASVVK